MAADFVAAAFRDAGLKPAGTQGFIQPVPFVVRSLDESQSSVTMIRNGKAEKLVLGQDASFVLRAPLAPSVEASLERVVSLAERSRLAGRWLDFGYGEGGVLEVAQRRGWSCYGVEITRSMLDYGASKGWAVTSDPRGDPRFADGTFDVVTMIEVLEHVADPGCLLRDAARWLRPGGLLYVTTPNARGLNCRILGQAWSVVCPPQHLVLWTPRALRVALARAGFKTSRLRAEGLNPAEILAWLREGRSGAESVNRYESGLALSAALERSRVRRIAKAVVNRGLSALGLGDTLKVWASRAT
jgi:2-polyprenyl-3-methyl-5-hydroxy-6-metoxy-1,4-benzoquinol methylase